MININPHSDNASKLKPLQAEDVLVLDGTREHLSYNHLSLLVAGSVAACQIKQFLDPNVCREIAYRLQEHPECHEHASVERMRLLGIPYHMVATNQGLREAYYSSAVSYSQSLRKLAEPFASPLDKILGVLNEAWPAGVTNERLECGRRMSPGIIRIFGDGVDALPHHDRLSEEAPMSSRAQGLIAQLGLNLYLAMPQAGGELELYLREFSASEYERLANGSYGIDRALLGVPATTIRPNVGDLVLIRTREMHAIAAARGDTPRITMSTFVGVRNETIPLTMWG